MSPSNPVFMLVMKRVGKALRSFVLDRTIAENTKDTGTAHTHTRARKVPPRPPSRPDMCLAPGLIQSSGLPHILTSTCDHWL